MRARRPPMCRPRNWKHRDWQLAHRNNRNGNHNNNNNVNVPLAVLFILVPTIQFASFARPTAQGSPLTWPVRGPYKRRLWPSSGWEKWPLSSATMVCAPARPPVVVAQLRRRPLDKLDLVDGGKGTK